MSDKILFVDDEVRVVSALQRSLFRIYQTDIASGPADALDAIVKTSYAVIVSDLQMPVMNGIDLLTTVKEASPETVRVLLTGRADLDAAIAAVNEGNIFRFLTKPCPQEQLVRTLDAALEQHRLQIAEKDVLRQTLMGTVAVLVDILGAIQPVAFGRAARIRYCVTRLAAELHLPETWEFEAAAMLSNIGCISTDPLLLKKHYAGEALAPEEVAAVLSQAHAGEKLLQRIPRLHAVSAMIGGQFQAFARSSGAGSEQFTIAIGAQMLRVAHDFDRLVETGMAPDAVIGEMGRHQSEYNPEVFGALQRIGHDLMPGVALAEPLATAGELAAEGQFLLPVTARILGALREASRRRAS
jgi:response regulator RpfG family c-di-GMP phosphodiesterase